MYIWVKKIIVKEKNDDEDLDLSISCWIEANLNKSVRKEAEIKHTEWLTLTESPNGDDPVDRLREIPTSSKKQNCANCSWKMFGHTACLM